MEKKIYDTRVIPLVRHEKKVINEKTYTIVKENITNDEIKNMSCEPRMLWKTKEHIYIAEMPLIFHGGTNIKWALYYVFDELTKEEQKKYYDRSITIPTTIEKVVQVYDESSKKIFGRRKNKKRK